MAFDEFGFHRRRTVPRWEWMGHALDSLVFLACLTLPLLVARHPRISAFLRGWRWVLASSSPRTSSSTSAYVRVASIGFMRCCSSCTPSFCSRRPFSGSASGPPPCLESLDQLCPWPAWMLLLQVVLVSGFLVFQIALLVKAPLGGRKGTRKSTTPSTTNWATGGIRATDDPVALLRAESRLRTSLGGF